MTITNLIITAYCSCSLCCGKAGKPTASGLMPTANHTIAASRSIPFGTKVEINGHLYTVEDRLAKRFDSRIDIYMPTHKAALKFGKQTLKVTIYDHNSKIQRSH